MAYSLDDLREWLVAEHGGTVDTDRLRVVQEQLTRMCLDCVPGVVLELGCFRGAMSVWMRSVLDRSGGRDRAIHVFDSFQGLPSPGPQDGTRLAEGKLYASEEDFHHTHDTWGLPYPVTHVGWFADTLPQWKAAPVAFAYLDGDFYSSIKISLEYVVPNMSKGAVLVVDDYADAERNPRAWPHLPGVKRACDDYFGLPSPIEVVIGDGELAHGLYRAG